MFSKLNSMAEEFVPHSVANHGLNGGFFTNNSFLQNNNNISRNAHANGNGAGRRKKIFSQGKRRLNSRTSMAQWEEITRRTVYVSDIDQKCRSLKSSLQYEGGYMSDVKDMNNWIVYSHKSGNKIVGGSNGDIVLDH
ncbi:hypothetical protein REPUB_Repub08aG0185200 [Reevesia pubescens]